MTEAALENLHHFVRLVPLGFLVAVYGSMIGAGGGFVLVPFLLLFMPKELTPATVTSISLSVVFFNAYSGTITYALMKRIHYYLGAMFALAGIPAVILGATLIREVPRRPFTIGFGLLLCVLGAYLALRPHGGQESANKEAPTGNSHGENAKSSDAPKHARLGVIVAAYVQFCSGLLGIGGGIIQVPFLIKVMRLRPHVATATSLFILAIASLTGIIAHVAHDLAHPEESTFFIGLDKAAYLAVGALMGAPVGAFLSQRIRGSALVRLLSIALCLVGARLLWKAFMGQA